MENMMWEVVEFVFAGVNTLLTYLFIRAFLKKVRKIPFVFGLFAIIVVIIVKFVVSYLFIDNTIILSGVSVLSAFSIGVIFFRDKLYGVTVASFFTTVTGTISELLALFMITTFQEVPIWEMQQHNIYRLQGRTLSILFFLIIIILVRRFRATEMSIMSTKLALALCSLPIASIFIVQQFIIHVVLTAYVPTVSESIPLISIMLVNVFVFVTIENIIRQNEKNRKLILIEVQNEAHQKHINHLMAFQLEIRKMSHDFKQQVQELYTLCIEEKYVDLLSKLSDIANRHSKNLLVDTGNIMLDSIITSKIERTEKEKIDFRRKLDVQANLRYINSEICVLLGNALDNAVEACMRSDEDKFIGMELTATSSQFLCHIMNSIGTPPQQEGEFIKTSKQDTLHHGIGMQSMKQTCDDMGGYMTYKFDEKYFNIWIKLTFTDA